MAIDDNMSEVEKVRLLHEAGCKYTKPLLGWRPGVGPRCRLCNTVAKVPS